MAEILEMRATVVDLVEHLHLVVLEVLEVLLGLLYRAVLVLPISAAFAERMFCEI